MGDQSNNSNTVFPELNLFDEPEPSDNSAKDAGEKDDLELVMEIQDDTGHQAADNKAELSNEQSESETDIAKNTKEDPDEIEFEIETISEDEIVEDETTADSKNSKIDTQPEKDLLTATAEGSEADDFIGLSDNDVDDKTPIDKKLASEESGEKPSDSGRSKKNTVKNDETNDPKDSNKKKKTCEATAKGPEEKMASKRWSSEKKIISLTLFALISVGFILYSKPSIVGLKQESNPDPPKAIGASNPVQTVQKQVLAPKPASKRDIFITKIEDAARLRDELLEKKEEIYKLKQHFYNGIVDLQEQIRKKIQKLGISSYTQALNNKGIELDLRTIQRRRAYIRGLEKPTQWIHLGSEELLHLKRKAQLDLQLSDIVGGIDLEKHMRYIGAAIQKYQPSAEKLAIDPLEDELQTLEIIWSQVGSQQNKIEQISLVSEDDEITEQICNGNFARIAELSTINTSAAECLSKMNGAHLLLSGLTKISLDEAKHLFQWHGNWICLNGVRKLSPAVAEYLFKWEGDWISLNGLTEFPAELAMHLMKWNGKQLELMGLNYNTEQADQKALKYLALWETTGGKLFVSDDVRKEMLRVMM